MEPPGGRERECEIIEKSEAILELSVNGFEENNSKIGGTSITYALVQ